MSHSSASEFCNASQFNAQRIGRRPYEILKSSRVREVSFCKRCVVASAELRSVASVYEQCPKAVLVEAIQKCRRVAQTELSKRMSRRLASPQSHVQQRVMFGRVEMSNMRKSRRASKSVSSWRPLSVCVSEVLRDVRSSHVPEVQVPQGPKLN